MCSTTALNRLNVVFRALQKPDFYAALGLVLAEAMRNRDDDRLRHYRVLWPKGNVGDKSAWAKRYACGKVARLHPP
jgi:hypothetical protein